MSSMSVPLPSNYAPDYGSELKAGTEICFVSDTRLAAALVSVGVPLRKDPPYVQVKRANGALQTVFHFYPTDEQGQLKTVELIKAWSQDIRFIEANPLHPFTFAMCALRNYQQILEHLATDKPWVQFEGKQDGKKVTLLVKEGSPKHKAATSKGLKQI